METSANAAAACDARNTTRRSLLVGAIHGIWAVIAAALGVPASAYLLQRPKSGGNNEWIEAGDVTALPVGRPVKLVFRRNRSDGWKVINEKLTAWVVRTPNHEVVALGPRCTHLGCAHHWDEGKKHFVCPCHNSLFSIEGTVLAGPAARPLDRYEVKLDGNRLLVGNLRHRTERVS